MFKRLTRNNEPDSLDNLIEGLIDTVDNDGFPEDPAEQLEFLKGLEEIRNNRSRRTFDPDKALVVAGNLLGILVIVAYEQKHVLTSSGLKQLLRPSS